MKFDYETREWRHTDTVAIKDAIPCRVTYPEHVQIGGGDPCRVPEYSYRALYRNGAVLTPRLIDDVTVFDCSFTVQGAPPLTNAAIKRYMTNHGTYAARAGGSPVIIERA